MGAAGFGRRVEVREEGRSPPGGEVVEPPASSSDLPFSVATLGSCGPTPGVVRGSVHNRGH